MGDYSKTFIVGNVGADPKITTFKDGTKVANLSIATNQVWKDKNGESKLKTEWHNVVIRDNNLVEKVVEPHIKKGSKVLIEGQNETRGYEKNGDKHEITEVLVRPFHGNLQLLSDPKKPGGPA